MMIYISFQLFHYTYYQDASLKESLRISIPIFIYQFFILFG